MRSFENKPRKSEGKRERIMKERTKERKKGWKKESKEQDWEKCPGKIGTDASETLLGNIISRPGLGVLSCLYLWATGWTPSPTTGTWRAVIWRFRSCLITWVVTINLPNPGALVTSLIAISCQGKGYTLVPADSQNISVWRNVRCISALEHGSMISVFRIH